MCRWKKVFGASSIFNSEKLRAMSDRFNVARKVNITSELPLSNLPDFLHKSSEENVDNATLEAPSVALVWSSQTKGFFEYQVWSCIYLWDAQVFLELAVLTAEAGKGPNVPLSNF